MNLRKVVCLITTFFFGGGVGKGVNKISSLQVKYKVAVFQIPQIFPNILRNNLP